MIRGNLKIHCAMTPTYFDVIYVMMIQGLYVHVIYNI